MRGRGPTHLDADASPSSVAEGRRGLAAVWKRLMRRLLEGGLLLVPVGGGPAEASPRLGWKVVRGAGNREVLREGGVR